MYSTCYMHASVYVFKHLIAYSAPHATFQLCVEEVRISELHVHVMYRVEYCNDLHVDYVKHCDDLL